MKSLQHGYLIKHGKRVFLSLITSSSPVVKNSTIFACWVGKWHPFPRPYTLHPKLGLDTLVALAWWIKEYDISTYDSDQYIQYFQLMKISKHFICSIFFCFQELYINSKLYQISCTVKYKEKKNILRWLATVWWKQRGKVFAGVWVEECIQLTMHPLRPPHHFLLSPPLRHIFAQPKNNFLGNLRCRWPLQLQNVSHVSHLAQSISPEKLFNKVSTKSERKILQCFTCTIFLYLMVTMKLHCTLVM